MSTNITYLPVFHPALLFLVLCLVSCQGEEKKQAVKPALSVSDNARYLIDENGQPFFWLGGTTWGITEWLTREEVNKYLDHRKTQGFNVVQLCLFWGKREDDPVTFTTNPPNAYGFKAFAEVNGTPDPTQPHTVEGGSPESPNDYWDHVDYVLQAAEERDFMVALLPVWGRRYVNATHENFSDSLFTVEAMRSHGAFLGERYQGCSNIIWVMGGDVKADNGGDFLAHYRAMAEGIVEGITGETAHWNDRSPLWDYALMTYHPDGAPMINSSQCFHQDAWLDFNMIETFKNVDSVYPAVQQDYQLRDPVKPTVMGEPGYEGFPQQDAVITGVQMRRQAYQSILGGAAGFTYGGFRDTAGNGPLFSPFTGWEKLLNMEGANSMKYVKSFCLDHHWPTWTAQPDIVTDNVGEGELQKVAIVSEPEQECIIYFPDSSSATLNVTSYFKDADSLTLQWYNPSSGAYTDSVVVSISQATLEVQPPSGWSDALLTLRL